jgi:hypothetical protein
MRFSSFVIFVSLSAATALAQQPPANGLPPAGSPAATTAGTTPGAAAARAKPVKKPGTKPSASKPASAAPSKPAPADAKASGNAPPPEVPSSPSSLAREKQELQQLRGTTLNLIRLLVEQGVLTREKAEQLVLEAERAAIAPTIAPAPSPASIATDPAAPSGPDGVPPADSAAPGTAEAGPQSTRRGRREAGVVRVPYVPELVRNQIRDEVKEEVLAQAKTEHWGDPGTMPAWLDRVSIDGDLRFRYQSNMYSDSNTPVLQYNALTGANLSNTTVDESRYAVRARLGINGKLSEPLMARMSFTTGNGLNPISLNQNFANSFSGYGVQLDQAYLRYTPSSWATGWIGRMPKPFVSTEMMFWDDINVDGAAATLRRQFSDTSDAFLTGGAFLVQKSTSSATTPNPRTKSLLAIQLGGSYDVASATRLNGSIGYYDYQNIEGIPNASLNSREFDWTAPLFRQKGNSLFNIDNDGDPTTNTFALAPKFKIVDLNASMDLAHFDPYVVRVSGNFLQNIGYDRAEILARTGRDIEPHTRGYQTAILVGKLQIRQLHDWHAFIIYRRLQRDAVVDAFNDPDFNLGGTNYKGYQVGLRYGVAPDTWLRLRWSSSDQIDAFTDAAQPLAARYSVDVLQIDLNARF